MRYQTHTPDAPGPRPGGVFIADRLAWQMNLPTRPQRLVILAEDQFGEIGSPTARRGAPPPPAPRARRGGAPPAGGKLPDSWRIIVLDAIQAGMHIRSGLHTFIGDDPEFAAAAGAGGARDNAP